MPAEENDAVSAVSELEVREWLEEQGVGAEELDGGGKRLGGRQSGGLLCAPPACS